MIKYIPFILILNLNAQINRFWVSGSYGVEPQYNRKTTANHWKMRYSDGAIGNTNCMDSGFEYSFIRYEFQQGYTQTVTVEFDYYVNNGMGYYTWNTPNEFFHWTNDSGRHWNESYNVAELLNYLPMNKREIFEFDTNWYHCKYTFKAGKDVSVRFSYDVQGIRLVGEYDPRSSKGAGFWIKNFIMYPSNMQATLDAGIALGFDKKEPTKPKPDLTKYEGKYFDLLGRECTPVEGSIYVILKGDKFIKISYPH